ncbi:MAG: glycosyltransferase family 2 protein [Sedimentisphaerales bacterium]|nr:glycosyltransferase family 2 protein [Sedimentisphaerales bacterium]
METSANLQKQLSEQTIAVVIPCFRVAESIGRVIEHLPDWIDHIIIVDDCCPQQSGRVAQQSSDPRVSVLFHPKNQGVGGAVKTGYRRALELDCQIVVKMDGDDQMDPAYLPALLEGLLAGRADYAKGNRFGDFGALRSMPKHRLIGNNLVSFMAKAFSGYWNVMDPANGYTAICRRVLAKLNLAKISSRYFFETDMLFHLNLVNAVVQDVPMAARYGDEVSSFKAREALLQFPPRLAYGIGKRILLRYFIYDFNMASVYLLLGVPMFLWGLIFGILQWVDSYRHGVPKTAGTVMLAALPLIIAFEMLLGAISIDIQNVPRKTK